MEDIKYISIAEFREFGFLQEINRKFLHPMGLALECVVCGDNVTLGGIWDYRDDPEGICYEEFVIDKEKADRVRAFRKERVKTRFARLGFIVQPVGRRK